MTRGPHAAGRRVGWWAAGIAQLVRTGWFRQVHVKAEASHAVRAELATRTLLVRMRCDLENQIRGVLKTFGLVVGKSPSRLVKRAYELVADELAEKPDFASLVESLLPRSANGRTAGEDGAGGAPAPGAPTSSSGSQRSTRSCGRAPGRRPCVDGS